MDMGFCEVLREAFATSDGCGKFVVFLLGAASAWCWSIMAQKYLQIRSVARQCRRYKQAFQACNGSPLEMVQRYGTSDVACGPLHAICEAGIRDVLAILGIRDFEQRDFFRHGTLPRKLTADEIDKIQSTMNRIATVQSGNLEDSFTILGTLVSISPLLGLFGTVWGVMVTFIGIAQQGRPDIATIAPGISGALLTTVCGLVVAIPTLFVNNWLQGTTEGIFADMDNFISDFITSLRLEEIQARDPVAPQTASSSGTAYSQMTPQPAVSRPVASQPVMAPCQTSTQGGQAAPQVPQPDYQQPVHRQTAVPTQQTFTLGDDEK